MSIGVAIIGGGIWAKEYHLPAVQASKELTLKAVYSRSLKSAKSLSENLSNVDLYSDDSGSGKTYHDLLLRSDIHGVLLALPIMKQAEYIEVALAAGKHVLSEKPIAEDVKRAEKLIHFYKSDKVKGNATWAVAENWRFTDSIIYASEEARKLGSVLGFTVKVLAYIRPEGKFFETEWRKKPEHQGGFLLDSGVHYVAGTRLLLGDTKPTAVAAYSTLLLKHLPPVDTINSIWHTSTGVSGTFSISYGTTLSANEFTIALENGSVTVDRNKVIVRKGHETEKNVTEKEFNDPTTGVTPEVAAWALGLVEGKPNPRQSPEQALADLEILEKLLRSGEGHGKTESLQHQI